MEVVDIKKILAPNLLIYIYLHCVRSLSWCATTLATLMHVHIRQRMKNISKYGHKCKPISYWLLKMINISMYLNRRPTYLLSSVMYCLAQAMEKNLSHRTFLLFFISPTFSSGYRFVQVYRPPYVYRKKIRGSPELRKKKSFFDEGNVYQFQRRDSLKN